MKKIHTICLSKIKCSCCHQTCTCKLNNLTVKCKNQELNKYYDFVALKQRIQNWLGTVSCNRAKVMIINLNVSGLKRTVGNICS